MEPQEFTVIPSKVEEFGRTALGVFCGILRFRSASLRMTAIEGADRK
jgi:hypothetical protein